jgi:hypothetical protein
MHFDLEVGQCECNLILKLDSVNALLSVDMIVVLAVCTTCPPPDIRM